MIVLLLLQSYKKEVSFSRETPRLHKIFYAMAFQVAALPLGGQIEIEVIAERSE